MQRHNPNRIAMFRCNFAKCVAEWLAKVLAGSLAKVLAGSLAALTSPTNHGCPPLCYFRCPRASHEPRKSSLNERREVLAPRSFDAKSIGLQPDRDANPWSKSTRRYASRPRLFAAQL